MKALSNIALIVGVVSLVIGAILRVMLKEVALGLTPSSFLEFSVACFLLTLALEAVAKR